MQELETETPHVAWKPFIVTSCESILSFYLATFCMGMFFLHRGSHWVMSGVFMLVLYLFVIFVCSKRVFEKLSMATVMLIIPIAPFLALCIVLSMIPLLQIFYR